MATNFPSWDSYFWEPGSPVLRNFYGERDGAVLARLEYAETAAQQFNIQSGAVVIPRSYDADHLRNIHWQLFGNAYVWAGEYRTVTILKGFSEFAPLGNVPQYLADASRMIGSGDWPAMDKSSFAAAAATVFAYVNQAHPFREGNGRASKLFMQHVSELSPYRIS